MHRMYRLTWEIDVDAESPREAAEKAFAIIREALTTATVLDVIKHDGSEVMRVDLLEPETERNPK